MPAKSNKQLKYIYAIRNKYGSKNKAPKKYKWVFGEEWGHMSKESHILKFSDYGIVESNEKLKSRANLDECWYNAKIGDIVPEEYIYNYIQYLHDDYEGAFVDGNLGDRIEEFSEYKLMEIPIKDIHINEWDLDDWAVSDFKKQIKGSGDYPPIVLGEIEDGKRTIIDGTHRSNALSELGYNTIIAWVGY